MSLAGSFGRSPPSPTVPSLLSPPNPATLLPELAPRGGILINHSRRASAADLHISTGPGPTPAPALTPGSPEVTKDAPSPAPASPGLPTTPTHPTTLEFVPAPSPASDRPPYSAKLSSAGGSLSGRSPRIRFAPLPDPHRPRSKSTGRDIVWDATLDDDGVRTSRWSIRRDSNDLQAVGDEDAVSDEEYDEDEKIERGRSWSKTMSVYSGWHGTKKLLGASGWAGAKERDGKSDATYSMGGPLKKSVSTGGMIGSSPFRFSSAEERKADMLGTSPGRSNSRERPTHTRTGSYDPGLAGTSVPSAATPVRMLNGRLYGARRASEAAEAEKRRMAAMEPKFVEWGHGKQGGGFGSISQSKEGDGERFRDGDEEDGSGMEWVRKRRQERQRRESEEQARRLSTAGSAVESDLEGDDTDQGRAASGASVDSHSAAPVTPPVEPRSLPTPLIKVSEPPEPVSPETKLSSPVQPGKRVEYVAPMEAPSGGASPAPVPVAAAKAAAASGLSALGAIDIAPGQGKRNDAVRGVDVWGSGSGDAAASPSKSRRRSGDGGRPRMGERRHSSDPGTEDEDEEDEDDGDFEKDDEEEEAEQEMLRSTSAAAGVEKFHSRHERDG